MLHNTKALFWRLALLSSTMKSSFSRFGDVIQNCRVQILHAFLTTTKTYVFSSLKPPSTPNSLSLFILKSKKSSSSSSFFVFFSASSPPGMRSMFCNVNTGSYQLWRIHCFHKRRAARSKLQTFFPKNDLRRHVAFDRSTQKCNLGIDITKIAIKLISFH